MKRLALSLAALVLAQGCAHLGADGVLATDTLDGHARRVGLLTPSRTQVQLWYERSGPADAPAVVLLNGMDSQAIYWPTDFVVALLDAGHQVIRYDAREAGFSQRLPFPDGFDPEAWTPEEAPPYPLAAHVDDLWGLLDGLGVSRAHLVGVSQGGMVAQLAALDAPDRVRSLTLLATTPSNPYDPVLGGVAPALLADLRVLAPRAGRAAAFAWLGCGRVVDAQTALLARMAGGDAAVRAEIRRYVRATCRRAGINGRSAQGFAVAGAPSRLEALRSLRVPTLVVHGRQDRFFGPAHAEALAAAIPGARLLWVDAGHGFPVRRFTEPIDAMLENFGRR